MNVFKKANYWTIGGNLLLMVLYTVLYRINGSGEMVLIFVAGILMLHITICLVVSGILFLISYKDQAKYWLLSSLLLLLVGFSTCYAVFTIK